MPKNTICQCQLAGLFPSPKLVQERLACKPSIICWKVLGLILSGNCVISIEVAGPQGFYDVQSTNVPFTIMASPFQLRGLAAYVVNNCVQRGGNVGGFATNQISNLANYLQDPNTDLSLPFRKTIRAIFSKHVSDTDLERNVVQLYLLTS